MSPSRGKNLRVVLAKHGEVTLTKEGLLQPPWKKKARPSRKFSERKWRRGIT